MVLRHPHKGSKRDIMLWGITVLVSNDIEGLLTVACLQLEAQ